MLKLREKTVTMLVAVESGGKIVPPCGVCREFLIQLDPENVSARVVLGSEKSTTLGQLLP
jgi:cytidine deaminase